MRILAVDSNSIMNRAFYGIKLLTAKDGTPTNAVYGFLSILLSSESEIKPDAVVFAFDVHEPTFRHKMYGEYKAGRHATPPELLAQFPIIKELLEKLGYPVVECSGWEADDILGTISRLCEETGNECFISTGDRDSLQLVGPGTTVRLATTKMGSPVSTMMTPEKIAEKYGVEPIDLIQTKALMGDSSDHIPGVPGIGEKTAFDLIRKYKTVDYIYEHLGEIDVKDGVRKKLSEGRDSCYMSLRLGTIDRYAPIESDLSAYMRKAPDQGGAARMLARLEMYKMAEKLGLGQETESVSELVSPEEEQTEAAVIESPAELLATLSENPVSDVLFESDGDDVTCAAVIDGEKIYLFENDGFFFDSAFAGFLSSNAEKRTDDLKFLSRWALNHSVTVKNPVMDTGLAGYILDVSGSDYTVSSLALGYHAKRMKSGYEGPHRELVDRALVFPDLCDRLGTELTNTDQMKVMTDIELPLAEVLAFMELGGFRIDPDGIRSFGAELDGAIEEKRKNVYELAGEEFNILSPKQLGVVLFEKLGLPCKKKTKTGYSTSADVLEDLRHEHPIIDEILEYRKLTKLKSTYVDGLLGALAPDGRVHSRFNQKETRTGRISSLEPNLQNIPIRTELGSRMRKFFIAKEGCTLIDADYSQIELRVLAHLSGDENMCRAFREGTDIHTQTASQVFNLPEDMVTPSMRSRAKAVNFGIVYGIGAFGLGEQLGVGYREAQEYINSYLAHYSGIDAFMKEAIEKAKDRGFAVSDYGRRRYLPELVSSNHQMRAFGERVARNMPIQGTAADIIKLAMVGTYRALREEGLDAGLILQVHDELIVEASLKDAERAAEILRDRMENAAVLSVPLLVDIKSGDSWYDAH